MRLSRYITGPLIAAMLLAAPVVQAQQIAMTPERPDCPSDDPDSLQISWVQPCEEGDWLLDTETGCRMWDWHPDMHDRAIWSGACPRGVKDGRGIVQWYEHGQAIDRFEGAYRNGKREGFGRYQWNVADYFEGHYANDVPDGFGTAVLAGETFAGDWKNGCMAKGTHIVAIGVPRSSCSGVPSAALTHDQAAAF
jgi:hypothetical protein